jgi:hypothetical protein
LIETETLVKLVDMHSRTPLNLQDMRKVFEVKGLLRLEDCLDLMTTIGRYERRQKLVPLVLQSLFKLQEEGDHTYTSDVRWHLKREFGQEEIQETLELLRELGFAKKLPEDQWVCMVNPETAARKFRAIADMFADEKARPIA